MYELTDDIAVNVDFNRASKDDEVWWTMKPLTNLDLSSNVLTNIPGKISMFQDLTILNVRIFIQKLNINQIILDCFCKLNTLLW